MKIALIPWSNEIKNNNIFIPKKEEYTDSHILLKQAFQQKGIEINTVDVYKDLREVDAFLFWGIEYKWLNKLIRLGLQNRTIYCNGEPAVVKPENSKEGFQKLLKIFAYILTWDDDLVDNIRIFKRNIPYYFEKGFGNIAFDERKLLTNISGNKVSTHPLELYSEREKVVTYFEQKHPEQFDLYGTGWDKSIHSSYQGMVLSKRETYHKYKFALSLENTYDVRGYITEKILDCFTSGIVPIYKGAKDVNVYIPKECYIDYDEFNSIEDMYQYLNNMSENEYSKYIKEIEKLLDSNIQDVFSSEKFCEYICVVLEQLGKVKLTIPYTYKKLLYRKEWEKLKSELILKCKIKIKNIIFKK